VQVGVEGGGALTVIVIGAGSFAPKLFVSEMLFAPVEPPVYVYVKLVPAAGVTVRGLPDVPLVKVPPAPPSDSVTVFVEPSNATELSTSQLADGVAV
jgi:hypothetical protein